MDHDEVGRYWNDNARAWTQLARAGFDVYRDHLNTPAFFALLPPVQGLAGLDIGCGEGHNTRLLAQRGARVTAIDIAEAFIRQAIEAEARAPLGIAYRVASAVALPCADRSFDFATAFMSLMDIPETERVLAEAHRVLRPGGFLQFSILHPCFMPPHRRNVRDARGRVVAVEVGDYFRELDGAVTQWHFSGLPKAMRAQVPAFKVPRFARPLSSWLNAVVGAGFVIERVEEPRPGEDALRACPQLAAAAVAPFFLHLRARRP